MNKKILIFTCLALFGLATAAAALPDFTPCNSVINPVTETVYSINNTNHELRVYTKNSTGWTAATPVALPASSNCYGLTVNSAGTKLLVSINAGASSLIRVYSLNGSGIPITNPAPVDITGWYFSLWPTSSPANMALAGTRLFVADKAIGRLLVFDPFNSDAAKRFVQEITDGVSGKPDLYGVAAVKTGTFTYKIYVSRKIYAGEIYVFNYGTLNGGTYSYSGTKITGLQYPSQLKVANGLLYVAVNGANGEDIKVIDTSTDQIVGTVKSGVSNAYGWNAFDVSSDSSLLVFKKAKSADQTSNGLYTIPTAGLTGTKTATEIVNDDNPAVIKSDGCVISLNKLKAALAFSPTGAFEDYDLSQSQNATPELPTLLKQYKLDGTTEIALTGNTNEKKIVCKFKVVDPDGDQMYPMVRYRKINGTAGEYVTVTGTTPFNSGATAQLTIPVSGDFEYSGYEWGAAAKDMSGATSLFSEPNPVDGASDFYVISDFYINSFNPADGATNISLNAPIIAQFTKPVDLNNGFTLVISPNIPLSLSWNADHTRVTATHAGNNFAVSTNYTVTVTAKDLAAQPLTGKAKYKFTTSSDPNKLSPYIVSTVPVAGEQNVLQTQPVVITFSETMNTGSTNVALNPDPSGAETVEWSNGDTVATIGHAPFAASTSYTATVSGQDTDGYTLIAGPVENPFTFTTGASDTISPEAITTLSAAVGSISGEINLKWTAVGDDLNVGTATGYIVKYTYDEMAGSIDTEPEFTAAQTYTQVWVPKVAGQLESFTLTGLNAAQKIWVSVKAVDEAGNQSPLGNCAVTIVKNNVPAPTITKIYPQKGPNGIVNHIVIKGTNLYNDMTAAIGATPLLNVSQLTDTMVEADVPLGITPGDYEVSVTCPGGVYDDAAHANPLNNFTVILPGTDITAPVAVSDLNAADGENNQSTLTWTNPADTDLREVVVLRKAGSYPANHNDVTATKVYGTLIPEPGASINQVDSTVVNGNTYYYAVFSRDTSDNWNDTVDSSLPGVNADTGKPGTGPTVVSIDPNNGIQGQTVAVINLVGANFVNGATVKLTRAAQPDINGTSVNVATPAYISCSIVIPGSAQVGDWNVVVTNPDLQSGSLNNGFKINAPGLAPTIASILPIKGKQGETIGATITGTNFVNGATAKLAKTAQPDIAGASVVVVNPTQITCNFDLPVSAQVGQWTVMVTNPDLQTGELVDGFEVEIAGGGNPPVTLTFDSQRGNIFWIAVPYTTPYTKASELVADINAQHGLAADSGTIINSIGRWDGPANPQVYQSYDYLEGLGWSGTDFNLVKGESVYLNIVVTTTFTLQGSNDPTFVFNLPYDVSRGNIFWVSVPYTGDYTNAVSIVADINTQAGLAADAGTLINSVGRWDGNTQQYQSYDYLEGLGWSGTNFTYEPVEGYYVNIAGTMNTWKPKVH